MKKLFIHFGPGGHPEVDRHFLNDQNITFLQQPYYSGSGEYLNTVIEDTRCKVEQALEGGGEVEIVAHSFGAFLVNQLPQELIDRLYRVHFIAPTFNFFHSLTNLFQYGVGHDAALLEADLNDLIKNPSPELFWGFFGKFVEVYPEYLSLYFHDQEKFKAYLEVAKDFPELEESSLVTAVNELITQFNIFPPVFKAYSNVSFYLGKFDPLVPEADRKLLDQTFGAEKIKLFDTGHFPHIEGRVTF